MGAWGITFTSACSDTIKSGHLPTETPGKALFWGAGMTDLVLISQGDYVVTYTGILADGYPALSKRDFNIIYSGMHASECDLPLSTEARLKLIQLPRGEVNRITFHQEGYNPDFTYEYIGDETVDIMGESRKLRVITKNGDYSNIYTDKNTGEFLGFSYGKEHTYLKKIRSFDNPDEKWVDFAKSLCSPALLK